MNTAFSQGHADAVNGRPPDPANGDEHNYNAGYKYGLERKDSPAISSEELIRNTEWARDAISDQGGGRLT